MNFVTIDFETSTEKRNSACSVGLVKFQNGIAISSFYSLIRPPRLYIRPDFTEIHGLTINDVKGAPKFIELWDSIIKPFISDFPLAAHNAVFDRTVLKSVLECNELPAPDLSFFCTCNLAKHTWPKLKSYALTSLARNFEITYNAHNALDDAMTCGKIVLMAAEKHGCKSVNKLLSITGLMMSDLG